MCEWCGVFADLDALAVPTGPGGCTVVRFGLATARGLALARGLPLIVVSSFEVAAAAASPDERAGRRTLAVTDSKRSEVFMQLFDADLAPLGDPREIAIAALATAVSPGPLLLTGESAESA